jgi:hypothetical protein
MSNQTPDDLDRLYSKLEWENPRSNFAARVMQRVQMAQQVQRVSAVLSLLALAALGIFAFAFGRGLTITGTLDYVIVLMSNLDVTLDEANDFLSAVVDRIPWLALAALGVSAAAIS